jgi:hypothetical protein
MEPAVLAWALNGGVAVVLAFALHFTKTEEAAVATIVTALAAAYAAARTRPVAVSAVVGALVTGVTAASAFGLHLSASEMGAGEAIVSGLLALLFRANVTPKAALKKMEFAEIRHFGSSIDAKAVAAAVTAELQKASRQM